MSAARGTGRDANSPSRSAPLRHRLRTSLAVRGKRLRDAKSQSSSAPLRASPRLRHRIWQALGQARGQRREAWIPIQPRPCHLGPLPRRIITSTCEQGGGFFFDLLLSIPLDRERGAKRSPACARQGGRMVAGVEQAACRPLQYDTGCHGVTDALNSHSGHRTASTLATGPELSRLHLYSLPSLLYKRNRLQRRLQRFLLTIPWQYSLQTFITWIVNLDYIH